MDRHRPDLRLALISDPHGNLVALDAVLADIKDLGVDRIYFLGDTCTLGPQPREVLEAVQGLSCPCIMGNHDSFLLDPELIRTYTQVPMIVEAVDWCRAQLTARDLDFLRTFEPTLEVDLGGDTLLLFHGTPRSNVENLLATTPPDEVDEMLASHQATVFAGGHTHIQMLRQHRGQLIVNVGSVGSPFETFAAGGPPRLLPHAEYATVEVRRGTLSVTLKRVEVDRAEALRALRATDNPMSARLAEV